MNGNYDNLADKYSTKPVGYYNLVRSEILPLVPRSSHRVLEVGCGTGVFGASLKAEISECEVWGVEPDSAAAAIAATRLDRVVNGTFSDSIPEMQEHSFDAVCFNDVLEHMIDPESSLRECRNLLASDGVVVASLPNILFFYQIVKILLEQDWRYEDSGIMDNTHLRFFTKKSIVRMFDSCGYEIEKIEGINSTVGLKYKLANAVLLGKLRDWRYLQFAVRARVKN